MQMQTLIRMDKIVIADYYYMKKGWKRVLDETNTSAINFFL